MVVLADELVERWQNMFTEARELLPQLSVEVISIAQLCKLIKTGALRCPLLQCQGSFLQV